MNAKVLLLVIGLIAGAAVGYFTRPQAAELSVAGVSIEIQGTEPAGNQGGSLTTGQQKHIGIAALVGALVGFGLGFVADRRRV